jgi:hypothetical protein
MALLLFITISARISQVDMFFKFAVPNLAKRWALKR